MEIKRKRLTTKNRKAFFDMYNGHCACCGTQITFRGMKISHKMPMSEGGEDTFENMIPLCRNCNKYKELYSNNADFKRYVDRYCVKYSEGKSIPLNEALQHELVRAYAERCTKEDCDEQKRNNSVPE